MALDVLPINDTKLVGILNLTPDSFSDGGKFNNLQAATIKIEELITHGANIIDVGAESTRPGAISLNHKEEWLRLKDILPIAVNLAHKNNIEISLDSRNYQTISKALDCGIDIINDVSGFIDQNIINLAAKSQKKLILMHNLGIPANKKVVIDENIDEIIEIKTWLSNKIKILLANKIKKENIIFDAGIGFGKNSQQSINIINNIEKFKEFNIDLYVGHSRKSFLDYYNFDKNIDVSDKDQKTLEISKFLQKSGVKYLRIHNILKHKHLLQIPI